MQRSRSGRCDRSKILSESTIAVTAEVCRSRITIAVWSWKASPSDIESTLHFGHNRCTLRTRVLLQGDFAAAIHEEEHVSHERLCQLGQSGRVDCCGDLFAVSIVANEAVPNG